VPWSGPRLSTIHKLQESPLTAASNWTPLMCKQHIKLPQSTNVIKTVSDTTVMERYLRQMEMAVTVLTAVVMVVIKVAEKISVNCGT
jgi:hypothetical protein